MFGKGENGDMVCDLFDCYVYNVRDGRREGETREAER